MHKSTSQRLALVVAALGALTAVPAHALDFGGYYRAGPQLQQANGHSRNCYDLDGANLIGAGHYRLGNECFSGGEFIVSQGYKFNNVDSTFKLMVTNFETGNTTGKLGIEIMAGEFKGFDVMPNATFYVGKVRERRGDVHILDTQFTDLSGNGAGFKGQPIGGATLGVGFYRADAAVAPVTAGAMSRFNVEVQEIALGGAGKLGLTLTSVSGKDAGAKNGSTVSLRWDTKLAGGDNTVWLQSSKGTAGINSNFGSASAASNDGKTRVVETFNWQSGALGGQLVAVAGSSKDTSAAGVQTKTDATSLGGRVSYGFTTNFKLIGEAGVMTAKANGVSSKLNKFTIAPTLSTGPEFWTRPELRFYVTSAKWNNAANAAVTNGLTGNNDGKTSGTSYGIQAEWWF